jgi:transposase-like protein
MKRMGKKKTSSPAVLTAVRSGAAAVVAAQRAGVHRSTIHRWRQAHKGTMPAASPQEAAQAWGAWARAQFELDRCELELVALGEAVLGIANDAGARPETRLAAAARFQAILRQLHLEAAYG